MLVLTCIIEVLEVYLDMTLPVTCMTCALEDAEIDNSVLQGRESRHSGGPFAVMNGALAEEVVCIHVPTGVELERPIHIIYATSV